MLNNLIYVSIPDMSLTFHSDLDSLGVKDEVYLLVN